MVWWGGQMPWVKSHNDEVLKEYPNLMDFLPYLDELNKESPRGKPRVDRVCRLLAVRPFLYFSNPPEQILKISRRRIGTSEPFLRPHEPILEAATVNLDRWINIH